MSKSRTILIFGATGGIGSALCHELMPRSVTTVLAGRNASRLRMLQKLLPDAEVIPCEATSAADVDAAVESVAQEYGSLDGVVNCVGSLLLKPAHLTRDDEWAQVIATNLTSAFYIVRAAARSMMRQETGGAIVMISSAAAQLGLSNHEAIAAAKAGVIGLARSAAATYARHNIRVNCVAPGLTDTPLTAHLTSNSASLTVSKAMHPLGRIAAPENIASAIAWLLEPANSFVTGQVIAVDGGLSSLQPRPQATAPS